MEKYNFNAGPSMLPREVIENTAKQMLDFNGCGLSLMEISHRAKYFQPVVDESVALIKELLDIPSGYSVIFLGGGASLQFMQIPANFLLKKAAYVNTGTWAKKAEKEAKLFGEVVEVASSADAGYTYYPKDFEVPADVDYLHVTTNNTIYGTEYRKDFDVDVPLIADMSSDIMSRPIDVSKYTAIYAGAQKNMAPAGLTVVIIKESLAGHELPITPTILNYQTMIEKDSMYNTPPCWNIYMLGLVLDWIDEQGGLEGMEKLRTLRSEMLYDVLDSSRLFRCHAEKGSRSGMNVTFRTGSEELDAKFVQEATAAGFVNLKGHRKVGGMRASIYNAMPVEGVEKLCDFIKAFDKNN